MLILTIIFVKIYCYWTRTVGVIAKGSRGPVFLRHSVVNIFLSGFPFSHLPTVLVRIFGPILHGRRTARGADHCSDDERKKRSSAVWRGADIVLLQRCRSVHHNGGINYHLDMETHPSGAAAVASHGGWLGAPCSNWCGCMAPVNAVDCKQDQEIRAELRTGRLVGRSASFSSSDDHIWRNERATSNERRAITISRWWFTIDAPTAQRMVSIGVASNLTWRDTFGPLSSLLYPLLLLQKSSYGVWGALWVFQRSPEHFNASQGNTTATCVSRWGIR